MDKNLRLKRLRVHDPAVKYIYKRDGSIKYFELERIGKVDDYVWELTIHFEFLLLQGKNIYSGVKTKNFDSMEAAEKWIVNKFYAIIENKENS